jgi:glycosyltransferase involved in cell wall biosynthesis
MRDSIPPKRPDVQVLFGKLLQRKEIFCDLIGPPSDEFNDAAPYWPGGNMAATRTGGMLIELLKPCNDLLAIMRMRSNYDIYQARDRTMSAIVTWATARVRGKPFVFWMSFPIVEGYENRSRDVGCSQGKLVWFANHLRAKIARLAYYKFIARRADHMFVQSEAMLEWMHTKGIPRERMTAVPMGVDTGLMQRDHIRPEDDVVLDGRRVIIYVGSLAKARCSEFLLDLVASLSLTEPRVLLVLAGDAVSDDERAWIRSEIEQRKLQGHVLLTGWLSQAQMLRFLVRAEVGLSPIPRGELFDISSPTKLVEYLAMGLPAVANDIPDQKLVLERSGAGICVAMEVVAFHDAVIKLLNDDSLRRLQAAAGPKFVMAERSYEILVQLVACKYRDIYAQWESGSRTL